MNESDRIKENTAVNDYEIRTRKLTLTSSPPYITIGTHYRCNARCTFCLGGDFPDFTLPLYRELFEAKMLPVLRNAFHVGFCGFGEVLLMPGIEEFLDHVDATLPDQVKVFTTNGIALTDGICDRLVAGRHSLLISLHASNARLHEQLTGTRSFDHIVGRIGHLTRLRERQKTIFHLNLVFLMTTQNMDDLPAFVRFAHSLGAERATCNYLTVFEPEQLKLSCFFRQERTNALLQEAEEIARSLNFTLVLPPRFGAHPKPEAIPCFDPWNFFYVETQGTVNPCCFAGDHIGNLRQDSFEDIWNGPGYADLRRGIAEGKTHTWCRYCYKYDANNINDIRSHVTFRPGTREKILDYLRAHAPEFPSYRESR